MSRRTNSRQPVPGLRSALGRLDAEGMAALLRDVPCLAEAVEGRGPLVPSWPYQLRPRPLDLDGLARLLDTPGGILFRLASLDAQAFALVQLAAWHGGTLTREQSAEEAPHTGAAELDAAARSVKERLLADPDGGWLALRPGVVPAVDLPGVPAAPSLEYVNSDVLADRLRALGWAVPARKAERIAAVVAALRDPDTIQRVIDDLPAAAGRAFAVLVRHGPQRVADLGVPYWPPYSRRGGDSALEVLLQRGLIGIDTHEQICFLWLDTLVGFRGGRLFGDAFPAARRPQSVPLPGDPLSLPPVLERLDGLLAHWQARPAEALAAGGLGVRPVREAAKAIGMQGPEVGLIASLAAEIGLLGVVETGASGRGRNRRTQRRWAPTPLVDEWREQPPARQWAHLVQAWRASPRLQELDGLPERLEHDKLAHDATAVAARAVWLRFLAEMPASAGISEDDVEQAAAARYPMLLGAQRRVEALLAVTRVLGLVPPSGHVGLTAAGRAVLDGPETLDALLPAPSTDVVVQADLTVIVPPDAAPEVTGALARWAELESAAGARVYRLSERRLAAALQAGDDDEDILDWLTEHSRVDVPQNVDYLIRDVARRRGRLRSGTAGSYLRSDDAALLSRAVGVRAAKLRLLAPTVAVSSLPREKLIAVLADRGVAAVAEDVSGSTVRSAPVRGERVGWRVDGPGLPPLDEVRPTAMAARLTGAGRSADETEDVIERLKRRSRELDAADPGPDMPASPDMLADTEFLFDPDDEQEMLG